MATSTHRLAGLVRRATRAGAIATAVAAGFAGIAAPSAGALAPVARSQSTAQAGQVERPAQVVRRSGHRGRSTDGTSTNWSGYATYGRTFTYVWGTWTVPTVNCSWFATGASSTWVGIDGYGTATVEQLGTRQNCLWGAASYYPWFEMYPQSEVALSSSYPVHPGDNMSAYVYYSSGYYYFYMADSTAGWTWYNTVRASSPPPRNATAEWIEEQPSCVYQCSWLANFGTVTFRRAYASGPSGGGPIWAFPNDAITMVDSSGAPKAVPSGLWPDSYGADFTVTFRHS